jgi:hypothetical protein
MPTDIREFPSLRKAYLAMEYDNGGIFRGRTEDDALTEASAVLKDTAGTELQLVDEFISTLSDEELETLAGGEHNDVLLIEARGPIRDDGVNLVQRIMGDLFDGASSDGINGLASLTQDQSQESEG